uniref:CSON006319 protein n=1 Tax=Culicoides sonorensis TaxID=179676 RepID=A0A336KAE2_CULSO
MSMSDKALRCKDSKYECHICSIHASEANKVFGVRRTMLADILPNKKAINMCECCIRKRINDIYDDETENYEANLNFRTLIESRIKGFKKGSINQVKIRLFLAKFVPNDDTQPSKRLKISETLESSVESGNTTTLAPLRGTQTGGGVPGRTVKQRYVPSSQDMDNPESGSSQSQRQSSTPRNRPSTSNEPLRGNSQESDDSARSVQAPRANIRSYYASSSAAPLQTPRIRAPEEKRTYGA